MHKKDSTNFVPSHKLFSTNKIILLALLSHFLVVSEYIYTLPITRNSSTGVGLDVSLYADDSNQPAIRLHDQNQANNEQPLGSHDSQYLPQNYKNQPHNGPIHVSGHDVRPTASQNYAPSGQKPNSILDIEVKNSYLPGLSVNPSLQKSGFNHTAFKQNDGSLHAIDRFEGSGAGPPNPSIHTKFDDTEGGDDDEDDDYDDSNADSGSGQNSNDMTSKKKTESTNNQSSDATKSAPPNENFYRPFRPPPVQSQGNPSESSPLPISPQFRPTKAPSSPIPVQFALPVVTTTTSTPKLQSTVITSENKINHTKIETDYDYEEETDDDDSEDASVFEDNDSSESDMINHNRSTIAKSPRLNSTGGYSNDDKSSKNSQVLIKPVTTSQPHIKPQPTQPPSIAATNVVTAQTTVVPSIPSTEATNSDDEEEEEEEEEDEEEEEQDFEEDKEDDDTLEGQNNTTEQSVQNQKFLIPSYETAKQTKIDRNLHVPAIQIQTQPTLQTNAPQSKPPENRERISKLGKDNVISTGLPDYLPVSPLSKSQSPAIVTVEPPLMPTRNVNPTTSPPYLHPTTTIAMMSTTIRTPPKVTQSMIIETTPLISFPNFYPSITTQPPNRSPTTPPMQGLPPPMIYMTTPKTRSPPIVTTNFIGYNKTISDSIDESLTRQIYDKAVEVYNEADKAVRSAFHMVWPTNFDWNSYTFEPLLTKPVFFMLTLAGAIIALVLTMMLVVYIITYQIQPMDDDISIY